MNIIRDEQNTQHPQPSGVPLRGYGGRYGGYSMGAPDVPGGQYGGSPYVVDQYGGRGAESYFDVERLIAAARRQILVIGACFLIALVSGAVYVLMAPKVFTSSTEVLIDASVAQVLNESSGQLAATNTQDDASVLNQIEVAQSRQMVDAVIAALQSDEVLGKLPENSRLASLARLKKSGQADEGGGDPDDAMQFILSKQFSARRVGRTAVLEFQYSAPSPAEAALVANTFAQVFISNQIQTKSDANKTAGEWLQQRLIELRGQSLQADQAIQKFKAENQIAEVDGKLVTDQQLSQISTQYVEAQNATAQAEARFNRLQQIIQTHDTNAVVDDALGSSIITDLRKRYLDATKRMTELSVRLGPGHEQIKRLNAERSELERLIFGELGRISESYRSDLDVARKRQAALEETFQSRVGSNSDIGKTLIKLRELQQNADVYRKLYETYLQRAQQSTQDQSFGESAVRIISLAKPSSSPSWPKKSLVLALAGVLGLGLGSGIGALREYRDRSVRSGEQIRAILGLNFFGEVPLIKGKGVRAKDGPDEAGVSVVSISNPLLRHAADHPMSAFAETLRGVRHAAGRLAPIEHAGRIISFASLIPGEGKTTMAVNFAALTASSGATVLLIDTDFRNPSMSRQVAPNSSTGLAEAIQTRRPYRDFVERETRTGIDILPINVGNPQSHSSELLSSPYMAELLQRARLDYDYVVLDLPPIGPIIDVRVLVPFVDILSLVVEWGRLPIGVLRSAVDQEPEVFDRCAGVILNKVDMKQNKLYAADSARSYLSSEYQKYYRN